MFNIEMERVENIGQIIREAKNNGEKNYILGLCGKYPDIW